MPLARRPASEPAQVQVQDHSFAVSSAPEQQFAALYDRLYPRLCDFAERFLDADEAHDAVHNALLEIWKRWEVLSIEGPPTAPYCFTAVRKQIAFFRRSSMRESRRMGQWLAALTRRADEDTLDVRMEHEEAAAIAEATLAAMPAAQREAWTLVRENGLTYQQAADAMDSAEVTARVRTAKAAKRLREAMSDAGYGDAAAAAAAAANRKRLAPSKPEGDQ